MPRNAEVIRQWNILREIEASQRVTIDRLARLGGVTTRTIRRDLDALAQAGFPLYDEREDGRTYWKLEGRAFRGLGAHGFTLSELCALYFSRTMLESLAGAMFHAELQQAFAKFEAVLPPAMRKFLDRLPGLLVAKPGPVKERSLSVLPETLARLTEATLHERRVAMRYHSFSSQRAKTYVVEPHRLVYAQGGLYLLAFVPEYREIRTFAVERIERLRLLEERFTRIRGLAEEVFPDSLGVSQGTAVPVCIEFAPPVAPYVRERTWHPSQSIQEQPDGAIVLDLRVVNDWSLRSWILSFGPLARVLTPPELAAQIHDDLDAARRRYAAPPPATPAARAARAIGPRSRRPGTY